MNATESIYANAIRVLAFGESEMELKTLHTRGAIDRLQSGNEAVRFFISAKIYARFLQRLRMSAVFGANIRNQRSCLGNGAHIALYVSIPIRQEDFQ